MRQYKTPKGLLERLAEIQTERRAVQKQADELHAEERTLLEQALRQSNWRFCCGPHSLHASATRKSC